MENIYWVFHLSLFFFLSALKIKTPNLLKG